MTSDEETEIRAYVAEREAARARGEHIDSDERREVLLIAALDEATRQRDEAREACERYRLDRDRARDYHRERAIAATRECDEARSQLAALHAAVAREVRGMVCGHVKCGCTKHTLMRILADLAAAAREHEQSIRADERAKALREAEVMLRRRAARALSAGATAVGLDGEVVRMHAGIYEAMVGEANALVKMADEAERRAR